MKTSSLKPDTRLKSIEIINEGKKYICKINITEDMIQANIFLDDKLKYKGNIFLEKIQSQIKTFFDYNLNEIFEEINQLNSNDFSIIKENNNYKLKIEFIILRKKRSIIINLVDNEKEVDKNKDIIKNYEKIIKEKDNIILDLKEKIKKLEKEKTQKENVINDSLYKDFNINSNNQIHQLNFHKDCINCLAILNDGRLVSGSDDNNIIIYNKETYKPDLIIKEHKNAVSCIIQLNSGKLASCSWDKTINIFNINDNNYEKVQTLDYHKDSIYKIIELKNENLVSCSEDSSIIFYYKDNSKYQIDYGFSASGSCSSIIQTKENEICYLEYINSKYNICFFDLKAKKIKCTISNINCNGSFYKTFNLIKKDLLAVGGDNNIYIINVNQYRLIKEIKIENSYSFYGFCMINKDMFLTGNDKGILMQFRIEGDNLNLISQKENAHEGDVCALLNLGNGHIASCSEDKSIKIW